MWPDRCRHPRCTILQVPQQVSCAIFRSYSQRSRWSRLKSFLNSGINHEDRQQKKKGKSSLFCIEVKLGGCRKGVCDPHKRCWSFHPCFLIVHLRLETSHDTDNTVSLFSSSRFFFLFHFYWMGQFLAPVRTLRPSRGIPFLFIYFLRKHKTVISVQIIIIIEISDIDFS